MNLPPPDKEQSGQDSTESAKKEKRSVDLGIATIIAAIIGVLGVGGGVVLDKLINDATPPASTATVSGLGFDYGSPHPITWCSSLNGSGAIPSDDALLIFDTPTDPNGQPLSSPSYSFDGEATQVTSTSWQLNPLYIGLPGANNFHDEIFGVIVSNTDYQFIHSITTSNNGPWKSGSLPFGQKIHLFVVTNGTKNECVPKPG